MAKAVVYTPNAVPTELSVSLLDWLRREFQQIAAGFSSQWQMPVSYAPPERLTEGMLEYADGTMWDPGAGKGVYVFDGSAWVKL